MRAFISHWRESVPRPCRAALVVAAALLASRAQSAFAQGTCSGGAGATATGGPAAGLLNAGAAAVPFPGGGGGVVTAQSQLQQQLLAQAFYQQQVLAAAQQMQAARERARQIQSRDGANCTRSETSRSSRSRFRRTGTAARVAATYGMSERERQILRNGLASR